MSMYHLMGAARAASTARLAKETADLSRRRTTEAAGNIRELEDRLDRLTLACMAMWSLLQEKTKLTEEDLMERVKQIDLADGQEDGKLKLGVSKCAGCGRVMARRHLRCLYCGADKLNATAFDGAL
jgi:predicted Zn-ribbon and HTH transcriptional regulator